MTEERPQPAHPQRPPEQASEVEILLARLVDGEATPRDRARFEELAARDPDLWRTLAQQQQRMAILAGEVQTRIDAAATVRLPGSSWRGRLAAWPIASSGWAAVLVVAVVWAVTSTSSGPATGRFGQAVGQEQIKLSEYKQAPFVVGEWQPILLDTERLPDERVLLRYLRRIEEYVYVPAAAELPVDADRRLTADPAALRDQSPEIQTYE